MVTDEQLAKLPRYARWEIEKLRADVKYLNQKFEDAERSMLKRATLDIGDGKRIDWVLRVDGEIDLSAHDGAISVLPQATNSITIQVKKYGER